ncbi:MAG TPA: acyltransferase family protein [Stellaceae bacterium]|nr:acyltransferase family protein [Stellaceae bacterium]
MVTEASRANAAFSADAVGGQNLRPNYRPDIDGLRAVAILSVVVYHYGPGLLPGGFLGVDIFFVISGFLISTIIFKSLANDSFSFTEFYAHRIRRIFPGLVLVIAFCLFVGWHALLPSEFILLGRHIFASTVFIENFRLWHEAGYFDIETTLKPLMHLWSLAIEEQFYLLFPLLVWITWRLRLSLLGLVLAILTVSFVFYLRDLDRRPIAAFFSPGARFWELMVGALLAYLALHHAEMLQRLRNFGQRRGAVGQDTFAPAALVISFVGVGLLGLALSGINFWPGLPNLTGEVCAVAGSALLIFSGPAGLTNRLVLASRPAVFVGLISYPLYLWHWPLLSYLTIIDGNYPSFGQRILAVTASFGLAIVTYRFVELPIRHGKTHRSTTTAGLIAASFGLFIAGLFARHLAPAYDDALLKVMQVWDFSGYPKSKAAGLDREYGFPAIGSNPDDKIVFAGDSHTIQYKQTVGALFDRNSTSANRFPRVIFLENKIVDNVPPDKSPLIKKLADDKSAKIVILSEFWALQRVSAKINFSVRCCGTGLMQMMGSQVPGSLSEERKNQMNDNLSELVTLLRESNKEVYLILDNPFGEELAPRSLLQRSFFHRIKMSVIPLSKRDAVERSEPTRSIIQKIAHETGATIIDPIEYLCDDNTCPALAENGMPIYKDYDHLSEYALTHVVHYLDFIIRQDVAD